MQGHNAPLLQVDNLSVCFKMYDQGMAHKSLKVISDLSMRLHSGEILAIVGSSGSGKSLLAHAVLGLLPRNASARGTMLYKGLPLDAPRQKQLRGRGISLIPQSVAYLDPLMQVGDQARGAGKSPTLPALQKAAFARLALAPATEKLYPFQLSGGMARRVLFCTALLADAELVIADEPTPGLHIDQAVEALGMLREMADAGKGVVLITHDIDLALRVADKVAVFYAGTTLEVAPVADFLAGPDALRHPYSKALWRALPQHDFLPIEGFQPHAAALPPGCLFAPRCPQKTCDCTNKKPPMQTLRGGEVRCIHAT